MGNWIDAHCHLADQRIADRVADFIAMAHSKGISGFLQGGVGPEDWERQRELRDRYPHEIGLCFGLHPYWVSEHTRDECEAALDLLSKGIGHGAALGELGLDFRPHIVKETEALQIEMFEAQLEIAELVQKPMVLHLVQAFEKAQQIFDLHGVPKASGMVHSFNGSAKQAEAYLKLGLKISVGGPLVRPDNQRLRQAVNEIPMESLLLESDSPDQPPPSHQGQMNEPSTIIEVAEIVAKIKKIPKEEVLDRASQNLRKLLGGTNFGLSQSSKA
jgi:TatD DNase family protein